MDWTDLNKTIFKQKDNHKILEWKDFNLNSVKNSLSNILNINVTELPGDPEFGSNIQKYLFSQLDLGTQILIQNEIEYAIKKYEPRVKIINIDLIPNYDYNELIISLKFWIIEDPEKREFEHRVSFEINL